MTQQIIFFGSSPFSIIVLQKLLNAQGSTLCAVVTTPDKPAGRHLKLTPNPVKTLAQKYNIPVIYDLGSRIYDLGSIGLVAAFGQILSQKVLDKFSGQIFNIHPSLLPKYRGASPLQQQILDGVVDTGVTIIKMDALMDHGPIVAVARDKILPDDTTVTLGNRLFALGADLIINNQLSIIKEQDHSQATYTKKLTRESGFISWKMFNDQSSMIKEKIEKMKRAFFPWPGVWTTNPEGKRIKLDL